MLQKQHQIFVVTSRFIVVGYLWERERDNAKSPIWENGDSNGETIAYFSRSFMHRYFANHHVAATSQVLTNLVFLARRKDQPLDKSVFIRKEEKPSSIYQPCPDYYSLSFFPKLAFLSSNVRHLSWLVSLIVVVEHQSSNFTPIRHPDD